MQAGDDAEATHRPALQRAAGGRRGYGRPRPAGRLRCRAASRPSAANPAAVKHRPRPLERRSGAAESPRAAAMAAHSFEERRSARSAAPAATMSPIAARIRQVMPAAAAMKTHFSHISCRICVAEPRVEARARSAPIASPRSFAESERMQLAEGQASGGTFRWTMSAVGVQQSPRSRRSPPSTRSLPNRSARRIEVPHAVQQRQDRRPRTDGLGEGRHRAVEIVGLATEDHEVERLGEARVP